MVFRKRSPPIGARPGTLALPADAAPPRVRLTRYSASELIELDIRDLSEIPAQRQPGSILWLDIQGLGHEPTLRELARQFDIHPLALEDVVHSPQRPKAEEYEAHDLLVSRRYFSEGGRLVLDQVSLLLGRDYLLSFREHESDALQPVRQRLREAVGLMRRSGADYLAYAVLDTLIDGYYPLFDDLGEHLDRLETQILERPGSHQLALLSSSKGMLAALRRGILPQREALQEILRGRGRFISDPVRVYLRDPHDHCAQLADVLDSHRELSSELINLYVSMVSHRTNDVMRILTIMSSIFIPLTFLAGIYGMNFEHMPELRLPWAYPLLLALMALMSGLMVVYFWRKGWLSDRGPDSG